MSRPPSPVFEVRPAIRLDRENPYLLSQQVLVFVRDQDRSLGFFVDCLGFNIAVDHRNERGERWVIVAPPDGTARLCLIAPPPESDEHALIGVGRATVFLTENIEAKYREWSGRGVRFLHPPEAAPWGNPVSGKVFSAMKGLSLRRSGFVSLLCCLLCGGAERMRPQSVSAHKQLEKLVDDNSANWKGISKQIWGFAELGYHEEKSSSLLQSQLKAAGFSVESGVADEPTGFIASYGQGKPVIAILGEFDALPGLSQQTVPERVPVTQGGSGHACGHNLLGSGAALAAVAVKQYMEANHIGGTLRYYGTPAEEGGDGKVYMVRAGLFKDVDVVLHWHPDDRNEVTNGGMLAITGAKFTFHGVAAHAAMAPDRGRSALDAVMLMGTGIEYMREHVPSNARIHYIITKGGVAPNIVPDLAQIDLIARHPSSATLQQIWSRLLDIAKGAAMMTGTTYDVTGISGDANIVSNDALGALVEKNLEVVGGYTMSETERTFAVDLQKTLNIDSPPSLDQTHEVEPLRRPDPNAPAASTDVGDVSWVVPTIGFTTATFVPGVAPHTWQAASSADMSIGQDGMVVASKVLAITAVDLFTNAQLISAARADFARELAGKQYHSSIPEGQTPPLDYRK